MERIRSRLRTGAYALLIFVLLTVIGIQQFRIIELKRRVLDLEMERLLHKKMIAAIELYLRREADRMGR